MVVEFTDELDTLRAQAEALDVKVDGRWGEARLREEIAAAQPDQEAPETGSDSTLSQDPGDGGDSDTDELEGDDEPDDDAGHGDTPYVRAGGHIDRGDGRGWVIEE